MDSSGISRVPPPIKENTVFSNLGLKKKEKKPNSTTTLPDWYFPMWPRSFWAWGRSPPDCSNRRGIWSRRIHRQTQRRVPSSGFRHRTAPGSLHSRTRRVGNRHSEKHILFNSRFKALSFTIRLKRNFFFKCSIHCKGISFTHIWDKQIPIFLN